MDTSICSRSTIIAWKHPSSSALGSLALELPNCCVGYPVAAYAPEFATRVNVVRFGRFSDGITFWRVPLSKKLDEISISMETYGGTSVLIEVLLREVTPQVDDLSADFQYGGHERNAVIAVFVLSVESLLKQRGAQVD